MNALSNEFAAWLSDFYALSTVLLTAVLLIGKVVAQPARRIAISWSAAFGLLVLAVLCAVPEWSTVHVNRPAPLPVAIIPAVLPSTAESDAFAEQTLQPMDETRAPRESRPPVAVVQSAPIHWEQVLTALMASGSLVTLLWLIGGAWQTRRLRGRAVPAPAALTELLDDLTSEGETTPGLGIVADLPVAVATGVLKPVILLPQSLVELPHLAKFRSVLAHELAHLRHRDLWMLALLRGLLVVLWAHPFMWLWRRQVRLDQESLADIAAADLTSRNDYAEQLVALARLSQTARLPRLASSVGLWENASQLKRRVTLLLDEKLTVLRSCTWRWRVFSATGLLACAVGLSLVTFSPPAPVLGKSQDQDVVTITQGRNTTSQPESQNSDLPTLVREGEPADLDSLRELVEAYEKMYQRIVALNKVGVQSGSREKQALTHFHLLTAHSELAEAQNQYAEARDHLEEAVEAAQRNVEALQTLYEVGNTDLEAVLEAKALRAKAKIALSRLQSRQSSRNSRNDHVSVEDPSSSREEQTQDGNNQPWNVQGRVTNIEGKGIANVEIRAATGRGTLRGGGTALTDAQGWYRLGFGPGMRTTVSENSPWGVGVQAASIYATKPGWFETNLCRQGDLLMTDQTAESIGDNIKAWGKSEDRVVFANQPRTVDFQLAPAAVLEGEFVETSHNWDVREQGFYIVGKELPPSSNVLESVETDKRGRFLIDSLPTGFDWRMGMRVSKTGLEIETESFRLEQPGRYRCRLVLEAKEGKAGQVELALSINDIQLLGEESEELTGESLTR